MSRSLTLPDELFNKLVQGAAQRGLTIEGLLEFVSELVVVPDQPTGQDQERSRCIEGLLSRYRDGRLTEPDRAELARLIDADYLEAIGRADRLIAAKQSLADVSRAYTPAQVGSSSRSARRSRK